jgi:hypothetical protein
MQPHELAFTGYTLCVHIKCNSLLFVGGVSNVLRQREFFLLMNFGLFLLN